MDVLKRRVLIRRAGKTVAAAAAGAVVLAGMASATTPSQAERDAERIRMLEQEIMDLGDDLLARPLLEEEERAKLKEKELEIEQWRERAEQQKSERMKYLRERDEARMLFVRQRRGDTVIVPDWADHRFYGG